MTTWIIDDGPFGTLAYEFEESWSWPPGTIHVMESVARSAQRDKSNRRQKLIAMKKGGHPSIVVHSIPVDTGAAEMLYNHLRTNSSASDSDLGEHEAIAFCAFDSSLTFVAQDKLACFLALAELGPNRVASPFDLWMDFKTRGLISPECFERLVARTAKTTGLLRPRRLG